MSRDYHYIEWWQFLSEAVGEQLDFYLWRYALIENVVDGVKDRHVDMGVAVYLFHAFCAEISFGTHLPLYLCTFHAVPLAYHCSEDSIAGEV